MTYFKVHLFDDLKGLSWTADDNKNLNGILRPFVLRKLDAVPAESKKATTPAAFIDELTRRFGIPRKLKNSRSLYEINGGKTRLYVRYSKKHPKNKTFFGVRKIDLQVLDGHNSILCFLWNDQKEPLFIPYQRFLKTFASLTPANDGQYKVQIFDQEGETELYIGRAGRFNVESYLGWNNFESLLRAQI